MVNLDSNVNEFDVDFWLILKIFLFFLGNLKS
jgi:hypothetical protein